LDALERVSSGRLFAIRNFGVNCLIDLLTAVEGGHGAASGDAVIAEPLTESPASEARAPSPRLTREASLLGSEPWSKDVSLYDIRFGHGLLRDDVAIKFAREALVTRRIGRDQRLCAELAFWDVDLMLCPLDPRTKKLLHMAGLTTLSALAPLTVRALLGLAGFGLRSLADLVAMLDLCPILARAREPSNREPTLADFCRAVVDRTRDPWFPEGLADRIEATRAKGIRCLALPLEEELGDLARSTRESRPDVVIEWLGWDGLGRRTREKVARAYRRSVVFVREIVNRLTGRLLDRPPWSPTLRRALAFCEQAHPLPAEEIAIQLQQNGLANGPFRPQGLITAAKLFGLTHKLSLQPFRGSDWLFEGDQRRLLSNSLRSAPSIVRAWGVGSVAYLAAMISKRSSRPVPEDTLRNWLCGLPHLHWLDEERQWFRSTNQRGSVEGALRKILAVSPEIHLGELRDGLIRRHRAPAAPPFPVLIRLCRELGLDVDGDLVRTRKPIRPEKVLTKHELVLFKILTANGPLLPTRDLQARCSRQGVNVNSLIAHLSYSPILARHGPGLHGLRGARTDPGEEELRRRLELPRNVTHHGCTKSGVPWMARKLTESAIRSGTMAIPAQMRNAVGEGRWPLLTVDGFRVGNVKCLRYSACGLRRAFSWHRANAGDVVNLEIDAKAGAATIRIGGPELLVQGPDEINVRFDFAAAEQIGELPVGTEAVLQKEFSSRFGSSSGT